MQRPGDINGSSTQRQCGFLGGEGRVMGRGEVCRTPPDGGSVWGRHGEGRGWDCMAEDGRAPGWGPRSHGSEKGAVGGRMLTEHEC